MSSTSARRGFSLGVRLAIALAIGLLAAAATFANLLHSGYGKRMLDWLKEEGRREGCSELQLISRVTREQAHRFYFREGLGIECFHFRAKL